MVSGGAKREFLEGFGHRRRLLWLEVPGPAATLSLGFSLRSSPSNLYLSSPLHRRQGPEDDKDETSAAVTTLMSPRSAASTIRA